MVLAGLNCVAQIWMKVRKLDFTVQDEGETSWDRMFSRGIDPDVQDPKLCHSHPDVPTAWPPLKDILSYTHKVGIATQLIPQ